MRRRLTAGGSAAAQAARCSPHEERGHNTEEEAERDHDAVAVACIYEAGQLIGGNVAVRGHLQRRHAHGTCGSGMYGGSGREGMHSPWGSGAWPLKKPLVMQSSAKDEEIMEKSGGGAARAEDKEEDGYAQRVIRLQARREVPPGLERP